MSRGWRTRPARGGIDRLACSGHKQTACHACKCAASPLDCSGAHASGPAALRQDWPFLGQVAPERPWVIASRRVGSARVDNAGECAWATALAGVPIAASGAKRVRARHRGAAGPRPSGRRRKVSHALVRSEEGRTPLASLAAALAPGLRRAAVTAVGELTLVGPDASHAWFATFVPELGSDEAPLPERECTVARDPP